MLSNKYTTQEGTVTTSISGGRSHFTARLPERSADVYKYELKHGENFHTLSGYIFGDDSYWWVLADLNKPMKPFELKVGDRIILPNSLINKKGKKFF